MSVNQGPRKPSTRFSAGHQNTWGPYWDEMFPPAKVTGWINFKRGSTGANISKRFWAQREYLRRAYESVYGSDPQAWPTRHPGVVLNAVPHIDHPACLGCQWFGGGSGSALLRAREHEISEGGSDA